MNFYQYKLFFFSAKVETSTRKANYTSVPDSCQQPSSVEEIQALNLQHPISKTDFIWVPIIKINLTVWTWINGDVHGMYAEF